MLAEGSRKKITLGKHRRFTADHAGVLYAMIHSCFKKRHLQRKNAVPRTHEDDAA
jgi:hypothetical protein